MSSSLSSARIRFWSIVALTVGLVLSGLASAPARGQEEPPDGELAPVQCPVFEGEPSAADEFTAYRYALACGVDVEVLSLRDVDRRVFATPAGMLDARIAVEPFWVRNEAGQWVDIDPALVAQADGSAVAAATVIGIKVGAGGDAAFLTATDPEGGVLSLTWPGGGLPAPVLTGAVATYPEVLPGVDLAVRAEPVGFSWVLVVKTAAAAADPALAQISIGMQTTGLTVVENPETGRIDVRNAAGELVFEAGQGIMWDSSVADEGEAAAAESLSLPAEQITQQEAGDAVDPGMIGEVAVEVTGSGLALIPDPAMLADQNVVFPLYIDPPFTSSRHAWANVYEGDRNRGWTGDSSWPREGGMRVGRNTWNYCGDGCGLWRSVITLNIGRLNGRYIASAEVKALQTHTGGCGSYGLQLWRVGKISNSASWNDVDWLYGDPLGTESPPSSNQSNCGSGHSNEWVSFDNANVRNRVQSAADRRYDTISFGFRSSDEGSRDAWRRIQTSSVKLHVTYYIYPPKPDRLELDGQACQTSESKASWITSNNPTMSARAKSYESESVYVRMRIRERDAAENYYWYRTPDPVGSYSTVNRRVTTSLPDGEYYWQARADSRHTSAVNSGYTDPCHFNVDATSPSMPTVTPEAGPYTEGQEIDLGVSSSDPVVNGVHSGLGRYEYSWNTPTYDQVATPDGSTTITLADAQPGRHVLYVRAADNAGNTSGERTYSFFVGRDIEATPMGLWRFEGDLFDDSGHRHDLTLSTGSGPVFGTDNEGRPGSALELDGDTCLSGQAPVRTDAAFSVALWVRMDVAHESYTKVLAQGGATSAYQIQHRSATNEWVFSVLSADYRWYSASAANPAAFGDWVHIAGTYDPDAGVSRIYVNGALAGERAVDFEPWNSMEFFSVGCLRTGHRLTGAIDGLGVWQGLLTPAQIQAAMKDLPGAAELARWEFRNGGVDSSRHGRDLVIPDHIEVGEDRYHRPNGAVELDGQTCLEHPGPVVPVDRSWSVALWVKLDELTDRASLVSTYSDSFDSGFELGVWRTGETAYLTLFSFYNEDYRSGWNLKQLELDRWHHVAVSFDHRERTRRVFLDGELLSENSSFHRPAYSDGDVLIGCTHLPTQDGQVVRGQYLDGSLQDVRLWRGAVSEADVAAMLGNPPATLSGTWRLEGWGTDTSGNGHDLSIEGRTRYADGWSCDFDSALELTGTGSASTDGQVLATDQSFTVSAWVRLDRLDTDMTVVSAAGQYTTGMRLRYSQSMQRFGFVMTDADTSDTGWATVYGGPAPQVDVWYHLVGVYDLHANEMRLYVSGDLVDINGGPATPWDAQGPLVLGAAGKADGDRWGELEGAVDDVLVWQGTVPGRIIGQISAAPVPMC